jgi:hypothetical protein
MAKRSGGLGAPFGAFFDFFTSYPQDSVILNKDIIE